MLASQALRSFLMGLELWKYIVIQFRSKAGFLTTHFFENCIQQFAGTVRLFYAAVSVPAVFPKAVFQSRGGGVIYQPEKKKQGSVSSEKKHCSNAEKRQNAKRRRGGGIFRLILAEDFRMGD